MEELADLVRDGEVFTVETDAEGFAVGYDDVVAHEYADLVAASATAIAAVDGVTEVVHEDRELLVVRAESHVADRDITAALDRFWRAAARAPSPWKETLKALATAIAPTMREAGFRKQARRWNREVVPGLVQVLELSRAETADGYEGSVDVGIYDHQAAALRHEWPRPKFVREIDCQVRHVAGSFPLTEDAGPLLDLLAAELLPLLERTRTRRGVLEAEWGHTIFNPIDRAIMLSLDGDRHAAHALLQELFEQSVARPHIHDVVSRCGLDPLLTGISPDRSRAEEAFLPQWLATQGSARARFRDTFARAGGDRRALDGSVRSLDALFARWRHVVARAQDDPSELPPSAFGGLPRGSWSSIRRWGPADPAPSASARQLAEDLASYFGEVLERAVPGAGWTVLETGSGLEPAIAGLPSGTADVMKRGIDFVMKALVPLTPDQERLYRRYNPMRAEVERWLDGAGARRGRLLGRFRRG